MEYPETFRDLVVSYEHAHMYPQMPSAKTRSAGQAALRSIQAVTRIEDSTPIDRLVLGDIESRLGRSGRMNSSTVTTYMRYLRSALNACMEQRKACQSFERSAEHRAQNQVPLVSVMPLRPNLRIEFPTDLTRTEADRISRFVSSLVIELLTVCGAE